MPQQQIDFFNNVFIEAKRLKNYLLSLSNKPYEDDSDAVITEEHAAFLEQMKAFAQETQETEDYDVIDIFKADQKDYKTVWYYKFSQNLLYEMVFSDNFLIFLLCFFECRKFNFLVRTISVLYHYSWQIAHHFINNNELSFFINFTL